MAADSVSAKVVGNSFVPQYYHLLQHSPGLVHRFYQDSSKLGRPEGDGSVSITTTMQAINEKIVSLNYENYRAEINSVDSQESCGGGVQVFVTGYLFRNDNTFRHFAQVFFLAPHETGFFVLNDIFRYLDNASVNPVVPGDVVVPLVDEPVLAVPVPVPCQEIHTSEQITPHIEESIAADVYDPSEKVGVHISDEVSKVKAADVVVAVPVSCQEIHTSEQITPHIKESIVAEVYDPSENVGIRISEEVSKVKAADAIKLDTQVVVESKAKLEEATKKSYASIVMDLKESAASSSPPVSASKKTPPVIVEQQNPANAPTNNGSVTSLESAVDNGNSQEDEADGYSIYIKGLPMNATNSLMEEVFRKFGTIKANGVQVRGNRLQGFCFGFIEFDEPSSVHKAIEASPISIGGRQAIIEEKRSTSSRGNSRGRFMHARGFGFGFRGRGNFGGGRGYSRGEFNGKSELYNRNGGREGFSSHDGYSKSENYNGDKGRMIRTSWVANGNVKNTTPRVSATA